MRILIRLTLLVAALLLGPAPAHAAEELSITEVLASGDELAGKEITVEGELIGDYGFRDEGSMWTQLNDDPYVDQPLREEGSPIGANIGVAVKMPTALAESLDPPGGYRNRGPVVRITGIWRYHDPERQGESYLEVQSLTVIESGRHLEAEANWTPIIFGALLLVGAGIVALLTPPKN